MKNKCFLKVIAPITFFIMVLVGTVSTTSIAQPTSPAVTQMSTNMIQSSNNTDSYYQEQNDPENEETINESDAENTEEDKESESESEEVGIEENNKQQDLPAGKAAITFDAAKQIAESFLNAGSATKIMLDDENGKLIYSVEIGSIDVKVDATNGTVLYTDKQ